MLVYQSLDVFLGVAAKDGSSGSSAFVRFASEDEVVFCFGTGIMEEVGKQDIFHIW